MSRLTMLHISDLHFGPSGSALLWPGLREELERDLRTMHRETGPWDVVALAGDLTLTGTARELDWMGATLRSLWDLLRSLRSDPVLLPVPGNHDLALRQDAGLEAQVRRWLDDPQARDLYAGDADHPLRAAAAMAFAPYSAWASAWLGAQGGAGVDVRPGLLPGDISVTLRRGPFRVGVVGLNTSALALCGGDAPPATLSEAQLLSAVGGSPAAWAKEHDLRILLTHHPLEALAPQARAEIARTLTPGLFHLHLAGQTHRAVLPWAAVDAMAPVRIQAPSFFGSGLEKEFGYNVVRVETRGGKQTIRLWPRVRARTAAGADVIVAREDVAPSGGMLRWVDGQPRSTRRLAAPGPAPEQAGLTLATTLDSNGPVAWLAWSPDGALLGVGAEDGVFEAWAVGERTPAWGRDFARVATNEIAWAPDGGAVAIASSRGLHVLHPDGTMNHRWTPAPSEGAVCVTWTDRGLLVGWGDGVVQRYDEELRALGEQLSHFGNDRPTALAELSDGAVWVGTWGGVWLVSGPTTSIFAGVGALDMALHPDGARVAVAQADGTISVRDSAGSEEARIEAHRELVSAVSFSGDGRLLASKSHDGTVKLWSVGDWTCLATLEEKADRRLFAGLAFHPTAPRLATLAPGGRGVRVWDVDADALLAATLQPPIRERSAKVVIVGEGAAGKSCLALRLAVDRFDAQMPATHGMRFWRVPLQTLDPEAPIPAGERREVVLWDLGGQEEYRQIHQLFLGDAAAALLVVEPRRGEGAIDDMRGWCRRLDTAAPRAARLVVGSKVDDATVPLSRVALDGLAAEAHAEGPLLTSASTGRGVDALRRAIARLVPWDEVPAISRDATFQAIEAEIRLLRESGRVTMRRLDLDTALAQSLGPRADAGAVDAVLGRLAQRGELTETTLSDGTRSVVLDLEHVSRYAGSLAIAARDNPRGAPTVDLSAVFAPGAALPRLDGDRLPAADERVVLEHVVRRLLESGVCLRNQGTLVFPAYFPRAGTGRAGDGLPVAIRYDFEGPVDAIYASLVAWLAQSGQFGAVRLLPDGAELAGEDGRPLAVRRADLGRAGSGVGRLDLAFSKETPAVERDLFVRLVDIHLRQSGIQVRESLDVACSRGHVVDEPLVRRRLDGGFDAVQCPDCDEHVPLLRPVSGTQPSAETQQRIAAIKTVVSASRHAAAGKAQREVSLAAAGSTTDAPLHLLHLSDLHVRADADVEVLLHPLLVDLRRRDWLGLDQLDGLVVSGDLTSTASDGEMRAAFAFLSRLVEELRLSADRCVVVPGNHDQAWFPSPYQWVDDQDPLATKGGQRVRQGGGWLVADPDDWPRRFGAFSQGVHHPLMQSQYPLDPLLQAAPVWIGSTGIQALGLNSAWEIDKYHPEQSSVHPGALMRGLDRLDKQAQERPGATPLRIAVVHHPPHGQGAMGDETWVEHLRAAGFRLILHGHVHEDRSEVIGWRSRRRVVTVGAGSFGAPAADRPPNVPRRYNLLAIDRDLDRVRVYTRQMTRDGGAWEPASCYEDPADANTTRSWFDI